jgi:hypothetical protein
MINIIPFALNYLCSNYIIITHFFVIFDSFC